MGIWSIMGVGFFAKDLPQYFGKFSRALLSCFQILTFDSWASDIAREVTDKLGFGFALYFVTYIFISNMIMLNVVVAVLLDKYLAATSDVTMKLDDSLEKLEKAVITRLEDMETRLKENNFKYAFSGMTPIE